LLAQARASFALPAPLTDTSHIGAAHTRSRPPAPQGSLAFAARRAHRQPPRAQTPATPESANAAAPRTAGGAAAAWPPASSGSTRRAYSSLPPSIAASRAHISRPACAERHRCVKCRRRLADHTPRKHQQGWLVGTPGKHQPGHTRRAARQPKKQKLRRWSARAARAPGARARRPRRLPCPPGRPTAQTWPSRPSGGPAARPPPAPRTRPRRPRRTLPLRPLQRPRPAPRGRSVGRPRSKDRSSAAAWAASARHAWRQSGTRVRAGEQGPRSPRHVPPALTRHGRMASQGALRHGTQRRAGDMAGASLRGKPSALYAAGGFSICVHRRAGGSGARARVRRRGAAGRPARRPRRPARARA